MIAGKTLIEQAIRLTEEEIDGARATILTESDRYRIRAAVERREEASKRLRVLRRLYEQ